MPAREVRQDMSSMGLSVERLAVGHTVVPRVLACGVGLAWPAVVLLRARPQTWQHGPARDERKQCGQE